MQASSVCRTRVAAQGQVHCPHPTHPGAQQRRATRCHAVPVTFEPQIDSQALTAQLVVLSMTAATAAFWWFSVVPSARRTLAKEKRQGPLNEYLLELQSNPNKQLERWFYTDWLQQLQRKQDMAAAARAKRAAAASTTEVQQQALEEQRFQQNQEEQQHAETDQQPSFWSLDNPILATAAALAGVGVVSSLLHH